MRFTIRDIICSGCPSTGSGLREGIYGNRVGETFLEIAGHHGFEVHEMWVATDHVHVFLSFLPRYSIAQVVGMLKSISASEMFEEFPKVKKQLWGGDF